MPHELRSNIWLEQLWGFIKDPADHDGIHIKLGGGGAGMSVLD